MAAILLVAYAVATLAWEGLVRVGWDEPITAMAAIGLGVLVSAVISKITGMAE